MFLFIGIMLGVMIGSIIGYKLNDLIKRINNGCCFKIFGYDIHIGREKSEVPKIVKMEKKEKQSATIKVKDKKCDTCNDEDMYIKGTKNLIPCPKCKRNRNKFKAPAK